MSHAGGKGLLLAALLLFSAPVWLRGEVIAAHDNRIEVGLEPSPAARPANRKFSDQTSIYLPQLHHQLRGDASGWLSTWNPHAGLGRPAVHVSGFSRAFAPTHLLSRLTDDALTLYTWLAVSAVSLTALFGYALLRSRGLSAAACSASALGLGLGVFSTYWLTFVLFLWGLAWTLALLWLVTLFARRATAARGLGIAFAVHALLLTGYPQQIVWHAYLVTGYALLALARADGDVRSRTRSGLLLAAAAALGAASALPVYWDLALDASRSARWDADPDFFLAAMPEIADWRDAAARLALWADASWLGNPIAQDFPARFSGVSAPPPVLSLALLTLMDGLPRRLWYLQVFAAAGFALALWPDAYRFGVEHLGLGVSRFSPAAATVIPLAVLAAHGADHVIRRGLGRRGTGLALVLLPGAVAAAGHGASGAALEPVLVANGVALLAGTALFAWTRLPAILLIVAGASALATAFPLRLVRPPEEIATGSPLVERVRAETGGRERFAWVGPGGGVVPSNQETWLGLRSIHTYDSLSSRAYQRWAARVSPPGTESHGRFFRSLDAHAPAPAAELAAAGVGLLLSRGNAPAPGTGAPVARIGDVALYRTPAPPVPQAQLTRFSPAGPGAVALPGGLAEAGPRAVERSLDRDDHLRFRLGAADQRTLLFVSQQCHPGWRARALDGAEASARLDGVCIDGFYQGVVVPPRTRAVELRFRGAVHWSWLPQLLFAAAAAALAMRSPARRAPRRGRA